MLKPIQSSIPYLKSSTSCFAFAVAKVVPTFISEAENEDGVKEYFPSQLGKNFAPLRYVMLWECINAANKAFGEDYPFSVKVKEAWIEARFEKSGSEMKKWMAQGFKASSPFYFKVLGGRKHF